MATYTVVGASASPLYTEKPDLIRSAILRATINDWPKTETIIDAIINGYNVDFRRAYEFGNDEYYRGSLQANNEDELIDWEDIRQWIADKYNVNTNDVTLLANEYASIFPNDEEYEISREFDTQGITVNPVNGYITGLPSVPDDYVAEINEVTTETYPEPTGYDRYEYKLEYTYFLPNDKTNTSVTGNFYVFESLLSETSSTPKFIKVKFVIPNSVELYLCYNPQDLYYPELSNLVLGTIKSEYFPTVLIKKGNINEDSVWIGEDPSLSEAENELQRADSVKMLDYYGTDLDTLIENLKTNEDVDDVTRAYVVPALPISDLQEFDTDVAHYLFKYIEYLIANYNPKTKEQYEATGDTFTGNTQYLWFYESIPSSSRIRLNWDYIDIIDIPYDETQQRYVFGKEINYTESYDSSAFPGKDFIGDSSYIYVDFHDKDNNKGYRARIGGLRSAIVDNVSNQAQTPLFTLRQAYPESGEDTITGIILPMCKEVLDNLSTKVATSALMSSLTLVSQSLEQVKLKWYEREDFWNAIKIILFVVSIIYMSPQLSAAASKGVSEIVMYILESVIIGQLITEAVGFVLSILADAIGGEAAVIIAAIAAAAAAIYGGTQSFNLNLPFADEILKLSNVIMTQIEALNQKRFKQLQQEIDEFREEYNQALDDLKEAQDLLPDLLLNPYWALESVTLGWGESPDDFLSRNINLNPNELCFSSITNFTENALRLPTLADVNNNF
jgi:hypothetical protein